MPNATSQAQLEREIAERLRPLCLNMPEAEFISLIRTIARLEHRYESRELEAFVNAQRFGRSDEP